jgi:hypothetical protein
VQVPEVGHFWEIDYIKSDLFEYSGHLHLNKQNKKFRKMGYRIRRMRSYQIHSRYRKLVSIFCNPIIALFYWVIGWCGNCIFNTRNNGTYNKLRYKIKFNIQTNTSAATAHCALSSQTDAGPRSLFDAAISTLCAGQLPTFASQCPPRLHPGG